MRADRLISILLMLQVRGKMTAEELAREMEVCERTIYRDIDALAVAGVPVYAEAGRQGGYCLLDNYRTNLTGLTSDEMSALFMLGSLSPLADLEKTDELQSALLKLSASSSGSLRQEEGKMRQCFLFDSTWWHGTDTPTAILRIIQKAVVQNQKLLITYRSYTSTMVDILVEPYSLVVKAGGWYLVYSVRDALRVLKISDLLDARVLDETFERPADFNLVEFWQRWCSEYQSFLSFFSATVRIAPQLTSKIPDYMGSRLVELADGGAKTECEGWTTWRLSFESFEAARTWMLGNGRSVEVLLPRALKLSVQDYARQVIGLYEKQN